MELILIVILSTSYFVDPIAACARDFYYVWMAMPTDYAYNCVKYCFTEIGYRDEYPIL